jgi:hypothetical protein
LRCVDESAPEPSATGNSDPRIFGSRATFSPIESTLDLTDLTPKSALIADNKAHMQKESSVG